MPPRPAHNPTQSTPDQDGSQQPQRDQSRLVALPNARQRQLEQLRDANPATRRGVGKFGWEHPDGCACDTCWPGLSPDRRIFDIVHVAGCRCNNCHNRRLVQTLNKRDAEAKRRREAAADEERRRKEEKEAEAKVKKDIKLAEARLKKEAKAAEARRKHMAKEFRKLVVDDSCREEQR